MSECVNLRYAAESAVDGAADPLAVGGGRGRGRGRGCARKDRGGSRVKHVRVACLNNGDVGWTKCG